MNHAFETTGPVTIGEYWDGVEADADRIDRLKGYLGLAVVTSYQLQQYKKGLGMAEKATEIHIAVNGVWSTKNRDGSHTFSYEKIGYHAGTDCLMLGFRESGVPIIDHRDPVA